jgi:5-methylcytosine-specific restriction endonuclease McrA
MGVCRSFRSRRLGGYAHVVDCACGCGRSVGGPSGRRYFWGHCPPEVTAERKKANARRRSAAYRERHPEKVKALFEAWVERQPEGSQAVRVKAYRDSLDPEVLRAQQKRSNQGRDPAAVRLNVRLRKQRMRGAPLTAEAREYVPVLLGDVCSYCDTSAEVVDHIEAVARGGRGEAANLTAACVSCNASKRDEPLLFFLLR